MNGKISFKAMFGVMSLAVLSACTSYEAPSKAVTHSSFTEVPAKEQLRMPVPANKILTLKDAQSLAVRNNPDFRTKYYAVVAGRAAYYAAFAPYLPKVTVSNTLKRGFSIPDNDAHKDQAN